MKKLIALILAAVLVFSLVACSVKTAAAETDQSDYYTRFITVESGVRGPWEGQGESIVVDVTTGVMYLVWDEPRMSHSIGGICALLNTDGTPMIWEGYEK